MTQDALKGLKPGDVIRHKQGHEALLVTANYGSHAIAVRMHHVANASEWDLICIVTHENVCDRRTA